MADTIKREELKAKMESSENFKLVEVLSKKDYEREHIKGAINIPLTVLEDEALKILDKNDEIIVYCADLECIASPYAAKRLREMGYKYVLDYEAGKADWKKAGYPMQTGSQKAAA